MNGYISINDHSIEVRVRSYLHRLGARGDRELRQVLEDAHVHRPVDLAQHLQGRPQRRIPRRVRGGGGGGAPRRRRRRQSATVAAATAAAAAPRCSKEHAGVVEVLRRGSKPCDVLLIFSFYVCISEKKKNTETLREGRGGAFGDRICTKDGGCDAKGRGREVPGDWRGAGGPAVGTQRMVNAVVVKADNTHPTKKRDGRGTTSFRRSI